MNEMDFSKVTMEPGKIIELEPMAPFDMALVKQRFTPYKALINNMLATAQAHEVTNDASAQGAIVMASEAKKLFKKLDAQRKEIVQNPNEFVKSVNNFVKNFSVDLNEIETILKTANSRYQQKKELARREAEKKAQEEARKLQAKLDAEAKKKNVEPVVYAEPILPKKDTIVRTDTGASASTVRTWKGEIIDPSAVERNFCEPSQKLINEAIKMGARSITGVRIYEHVDTRIRT